MGKKGSKKRHLNSKARGSSRLMPHAEGEGQPDAGHVSKEERLRLKKKAKRERLNKKKRERKQAALAAGVESRSLGGDDGSGNGTAGAVGIIHGQRAVADARGPSALKQGAIRPSAASAVTGDGGRGKKLKRLKGWFPGAVQARGAAGPGKILSVFI